MSDLSQTTERAAKRYIRRLDRLVVTLLGLRFTSPDGIWTLQLDLRSLQRDIQAEIAAIKRQRRSADRTEALERLHEVLWHARRFGDALAWLLLQGDRQLIYPWRRTSESPFHRTITRREASTQSRRT